MNPEQLQKLLEYIDARIDERAIVQTRDDFEPNHEIRKIKSEVFLRNLARAVNWDEEDES